MGTEGPLLATPWIVLSYSVYCSEVQLQAAIGLKKKTTTRNKTPTHEPRQVDYPLRHITSLHTPRQVIYKLKCKDGEGKLPQN